jgi:hypothetical protein
VQRQRVLVVERRRQLQRLLVGLLLHVAVQLLLWPGLRQLLLKSGSARMPACSPSPRSTQGGTADQSGLR